MLKKVLSNYSSYTLRLSLKQEQDSTQIYETVTRLYRGPPNTEFALH
jgi:hypothetical protein